MDWLHARGVRMCARRRPAAPRPKQPRALPHRPCLAHRNARRRNLLPSPSVKPQPQGSTTNMSGRASLTACSSGHLPMHHTLSTPAALALAAEGVGMGAGSSRFGRAASALRHAATAPGHGLGREASVHAEEVSAAGAGCSARRGGAHPTGRRGGEGGREGGPEVPRQANAKCTGPACVHVRRSCAACTTGTTDSGIWLG